MTHVSSGTTPASFNNLGIAQNFLDILHKLGYSVPTPIQHQAIPVAIAGHDVIGIAQTGTGKTLAFGIPMIQRLAAVQGKGMVILPTRELALQVDEVLRKIGGQLGLRTAVLIGGTGMHPQHQALKKNPHIIIATPGRLLDHVSQRTIDVQTIKILVLDEADRMLDMGFAPQIKKIMDVLPRERQIMLFSATMPQEIISLASRYMKLPLQIEVARAGTVTEQVEQELFMVKKEDKLRLLDTLLTRYTGTVLVFSRTKHGAKKICRSIKMMQHTAAELHANRSLNQRREALEGFKSGKYRTLVATDIAARGIDVQNIEVVINYDIPEDPEDYVHRIGRTGRAGKTGKAITFVAPDQKGKVRDIERLIRMNLPISQTPVLATGRTSSPTAQQPQKKNQPVRQHRQPSAHNRSKPRHSRHGAKTYSTSAPHNPSFNNVRSGERSSYPDLDTQLGIEHNNSDDKFFTRPVPRRQPRPRPGSDRRRNRG